MGRALGFIGLLIAVAVMGYLYMKDTQAVSGPTASPVATVNLTGVQNDLIEMANAERMYQASNGKYATIDELAANGTMNIKHRPREGWSYSSEAGDQNFRIIATYSGPAIAGVPHQLSIDQTMNLERQ